MGAQLCALMPPKVNAALSALMLLKRAVGGAGFLLPRSEAAVQSREGWFYNGRVALHRSLTRHRLSSQRSRPNPSGSLASQIWLPVADLVKDDGLHPPSWCLTRPSPN